MPLDARKIAHIKSNLVKVMKNRTQSVVLTLRAADGSTSTLTVNAIWRPAEDQDPIYDPSGKVGDDVLQADVAAMFNQADVTYAQMRSCAYAQLAAGQPGPAFASRYIPTAIYVKGLIPGGDRLIVTFDRQR